MADITLTVDFAQVNNLNTTLKSTDTLFVKVVDSLFRESKRADRVTKAFADTTQKNLDIINKAEAVVSAKLQQESDKREKARTREASRAEKEAQRIVAANDKIAKAEAKLAAEVARNQAAAAQRSTTALNDRLGVTGTPATGVGAGFATLDNEIERLRLKYDQIYASSQLYERSLAELNTAHRLGAISTKGHESAVESLNQEYQNFQNGIRQVGNRFVDHSNQTSDGMNRMGVAAQQTGYQVSDFIVQVQGGTNPLVAFSQQMTQMAGLLYLLPPALQATTYSFLGFKIALSTAFAGVAILIPLLASLAMAFFNSSKEAESGAKSVDVQKQAIDRLKESITALRLERQMAASGASTKDEQVAQNAINDLLEERLRLQASIAFSSSQEQKVASGGRSALAVEELKAREQVNQARLDEIDLVLKQLDYERQLEIASRRRANEQRNIYRQQKADADAQVVAQEELNKRLTSGKNLFHALAGETESVSIYLSDALRSALGLAKVDFSNVKTVADYLAIYQGQMGRGLPTTSGPTFTYPLNADNRYGPSFEQGGRGPIPAAAVNPTLEDLLGGTGTEGGTGPAEATQTAIEKLQEQLAVERELIGTSEAYQKVRSALGEEFKTTSPEVIAGLVDQATQVERLIDLEKQREQVLGTVKSSMEDTLMSIVDGTKSAKEAFKTMAAEIVKELYRVYVVQQLVNSVSGFIMPSKGPAGSVPRLSQAQPRAAGGSMMANMAYMVGENGPELVIPRHSGTVVNAKQTASAVGGGGNFTQNLSINVTGSDAAMVRTEVAKMIPQITNATKAAVLDAKQRGGQFAAAFR